MARPLKEIDKSQFEGLCGIQCTMNEICGWFHCSRKTLIAWCKRTYGKPFSEVFDEYKGVGKISLRRNQWHLSEINATMAIWLGKQYLNQRDKPTSQRVVDSDGDKSANIVTVDDLYGDD